MPIFLLINSGFTSLDVLKHILDGDQIGCNLIIDGWIDSCRRSFNKFTSHIMKLNQQISNNLVQVRICCYNKRLLD